MANEYGNLISVLTPLNNNGYKGDVAITFDGSFIVYSSKCPTGICLFALRIEDKERGLESIQVNIKTKLNCSLDKYLNINS